MNCSLQILRNRKSAGSLPDMLSNEEFFEGFSMPRNQEMMRIFKDLDLVEHLGSGIPRILDAYSTDCFRFTENFLRMTFPNAWDLSEEEDNEMPEGVESNTTPQVNPQVTPQVTPEVTPHVTDHATPEVTPEVLRLVKVMNGEMSRREISTLLGIRDEKHFRENYQQIALSFGVLEMTIPDKPNSRLQKYRLTPKGKALQNELKK
jgi:ATP-dependent DNA helicase RecG